MYKINCNNRIEASELEPFIVEWNVEFGNSEFEKRINNIINAHNLRFEISPKFYKKVSVSITSFSEEELKEYETYNILNGNIRFENKSKFDSFIKQYEKVVKKFLNEESEEYNKIIDSIK
ncbi:hypothetical protein [Clostridium kluyveri]|uniref:hypothetical protein n=1 Tax=Clostridium kluyveri TaxID=1534 RepID=UPI0022467C2E|nr:hypothetical protein [Clostridium kluyveri]UZQ49876.1 hypothetical protein OP486_18300 [Clostridium kluyveri]